MLISKEALVNRGLGDIIIFLFIRMLLMFAQHIIEEMLFVNYLIQDCIKKEFLFDE